MIHNEKGDFLLYIIFTVVIIIIGAILYFTYLNDNGTSDTKDSNFIEEFKTKLPPTKDQSSVEVFENTYSIQAKIKLDNKLEVNDKNVKIMGTPNLVISERNFKLSDPLITDFSGDFTKEGFNGSINYILSKFGELEIRSQIKSGYDDIEKILITDVYLDMENANISGYLKVQDKNYELNKIYLKMKGFSGNIEIVPSNNIIYAILDGNIGYLEMRDNQIVTLLK